MNSEDGVFRVTSTTKDSSTYIVDPKISNITHQEISIEAFEDATVERPVFAQSCASACATCVAAMGGGCGVTCGAACLSVVTLAGVAACAACAVTFCATAPLICQRCTRCTS